MSRDDFTIATKAKLAKRVGYKCSSPFCRKTTIGPQIAGDSTINIGEAAHICAASEGGKRYNADMTSDERKSYDNGIWLCRNHAALIDRDEKFFTVEMLRKWKEDAERDAGNELIGIETVKKCRYRMLIFYCDLKECKKSLEIIKWKRGTVINSTLLPIQNNWEQHLEEISDSIGAETTATLYNIVREIEEFKLVMEKVEKKMLGIRMANMETVEYGGRWDIFVDRMDEYFTEEFLDVIKSFTKLV